jgi:hypothetical protein
MNNRVAARRVLRPVRGVSEPVAPEPAEEDPLVELARIVSGQSALDAPRRRPQLAEEPGMSGGPRARSRPN